MSLNRVMLIGHLTADPEMRYTPQGTAVSTFSVATNRSWNDNTGQHQEAVEYTRCVAWSKLAEICSQMLAKGKRVFVEGRLQTREWEGQDSVKRRTTEVVLENMIALSPASSSSPSLSKSTKPKSTSSTGISTKPTKKPANDTTQNEETVPAEDIPF